MPASSAPLRLFLALWPDDATRAALAAWQQAWSWPPGAAVVKPERLHLTLHFLGDVPAERLPAIAAGSAVPFEPFDLELARAGVWPNGIAVLRAERTPAALLRLHASLAAALAALQLPVDQRPFRDHVTLARRARGATPAVAGRRLCWRVDAGYVLVRSLPGGAGYEVLNRFS